MLHILLSFILIPSWAMAVELVTLKSDKTSYVPYEKSILVTEILSYPLSSNLEVLIQHEVNGDAVEAVKVMGNKFISKVIDVGNAENVHFKSKYFLVNKTKRNEYQAAIHTSNSNISSLIQKRRTASTGERILIDTKILKEEERIFFFEAKINSLLKLVSEKNLIVPIVPNTQLLNNAFVFFSPERESGIYHPGELVTILAHVYTDLLGKQTLIKASLEGELLEVDKLINNEFIIRSQLFSTSDIGLKSLSLSLYIRDELRAFKLTDSLDSIEEELIRLNGEVANSSDPAEVAVLQVQIQKLSQVKDHIISILTGLEVHIETKTYKFKVENI